MSKGLPRMSRGLRRYEVLLPLRFNDGSPVPDDLIAQTLLELEAQFGGVSCEMQAIRGFWRHQGQSYREELTRVFVDAPDTRQTRAFFKRFKEVLKTRFQQIEIWLTTYPIETM
jgi:hypothetical protein